MNEQELKEKWQREAQKMTLGKLPEFLDRLMGHNHTYGSIVHAIGAGAIATAYAMDNHKNGGITGHQAGAIMWEMLYNWNFKTNKCGLKLVDFDEMLYPQYEEKFDKTISPQVWIHLVAEAKSNLTSKTIYAHEDVIKHWEDISNGIVPFGYTVKER